MVVAQIILYHLHTQQSFWENLQLDLVLSYLYLHLDNKKCIIKIIILNKISGMLTTYQWGYVDKVQFSFEIL